MDYIYVDKYRLLFNDHIEQALEYVKNLKEEDFKAKVCDLFIGGKKIKNFWISFFSRLIRSLSYFQLYVKYVLWLGINVSNK